MSAALKEQIPDRPEQTKTETQQITELETATETIAAYIGYLTTQMHIEEDKPIPDEFRIRALKAQKNALLGERKSVTPENEEMIAKALYIYGPIVKSLSI